LSIYSRFSASDPDSGRRDFLPSRSAQFDLTDLLLANVRSDSAEVAVVRGRNVEGVGPGRAEIRVTSPATGSVLGRGEVRVTRSTETLVAMEARVFSGLQLELVNNGQNDVVRRAKTTYSEKLTAMYQEGLLDINLAFSDGKRSNLKDFNPNEYFLSVASNKPNAIAFAPAEGARHPRVIAVGSGRGKLLEISLEAPDACADIMTTGALASTMAHVDVALANDPPPTKAVDMGDLGDVQDDQHYKHLPAHKEAAHSKPLNHHSGHGRHGDNANVFHLRMTPVEIGMYALLAVFCAAISVFVASCFVYASKFNAVERAAANRTSTPSLAHGPRSRSEQDAHDWVWLGKSTIDKATTSSVAGETSFCREPPEDLTRRSKESRNEKRKSQRLSYVGSEINIIPNPQTEEYEAEVSNPSSPDDVPPALPPKRLPRATARRQPPPPPPTVPPARRPFPEPFQEIPRRARHYRAGGPYDAIAARQFYEGHCHMAAMAGHPVVHTRRPPEYRPPTGNPNRRFAPPPRWPDYERPALLSAATSPMSDSEATTTPRSPPVEYRQPRRRALPINSATFTKKKEVMEEKEKEAIPLYPATGAAVEMADVTVAGQHDRTFSPLLLPDPTEALETCQDANASPLRQSPASALPPMAESEDLEDVALISPVKEERDLLEKQEEIKEENGPEVDDEEMPMNPDLERPSPPRLGAASAVVTDPFQPADDVCAPLSPEEDLSPCHIFETSAEELFAEQAETEAKEEGGGNLGMDYEQMMAYFESLKESTA